MNFFVSCRSPVHRSNSAASTKRSRLQRITTRKPRAISTALSSPDPGNSTNRDPIDISTDPNERPSIVQPSLLVQQYPSGPTTGNESSSLEDFMPIDSRRLQSGPHVALEVDPDNEEPNPRREASPAWKASPLIHSQAS